MRSRVSLIVDRIQQLPVTLFSPAGLARARWVDVAHNSCGIVCVPAYDLKPSPDPGQVDGFPALANASRWLLQFVDDEIGRPEFVVEIWVCGKLFVRGSRLPQTVEDESGFQEGRDVAG